MKRKTKLETNTSEKEIDNRSLCEKADDFVDDVMGTVKDVVIGESKGINEDIPARFEKDSGGYVIYKAKTKANISKKIFGKKGVIALFIILIIGLIICGIYYLINMMLLS